MSTTTTSAHGQVDALMQKAFPPGRPARSAAYMAGVRAKLHHALQCERLSCLYVQGSAEFDAFFAGICEGAAIAQIYGGTLA